MQRRAKKLNSIGIKCKVRREDTKKGKKYFRYQLPKLTVKAFSFVVVATS